MPVCIGGGQSLTGKQSNDSTLRNGSLESGNAHTKPTTRHRAPSAMSQTRNSSRSRTRHDYDGYGRDIGPSGSRTSGENVTVRKTDTAGRPLDPEDDDDFWIHRDKLARIESEELQQAAMRIQRQVRASSKSSSARVRSHDSQSINGTAAPNEQIEPWPAVKRQQLDSPIPLEDEPQTPTDAERMNWDLRRPEEIAAEASAADSDSSKMYKSPGLKKSTSRIPVLTTSPHPISAEQVDRELPSIQRARTRTLGSGDDESTSNPKPNSVANQVDNREASPDSSTPTASSSRPGSRGASSQLQTQASPAKRPAAKSVSSTTGRKASGPSNTRKTTTSQNSRSTSADKRPQTRSGDHRPTTSANSPEGDPPWLATMYKPDPRLPPEQQILPTHAKRMQQEQWEREGKTPSTYDRDFTPLAVRPDEPPRNSTTLDQEKENTTTSSPPEEKTEEAPKEDSNAWPLKSPKTPEPPRPGTSGTNYSTMPKVQNTPPVVLSTAAAQSSPSSPKAPAAAEQDDKVGKGCGCCIVM